QPRERRGVRLRRRLRHARQHHRAADPSGPGCEVRMVTRIRRAERIRRTSVVLVAAGVAYLAGCTPEIVDTTPLVDRPAVLAAIAVPAETRPGAPLALSALAVGPDGPAPRALDWALCTL